MLLNPRDELIRIELSGDDFVEKQALDQLGNAHLSWGTGRCDFAVNRRNNNEADVPALRERLALQGPVDHDVPVLRAARADGGVLGIKAAHPERPSARADRPRAAH
ncbi:MAG: hypothetical protein ACLQIB_12470 [Isosphaeraceae bacterium]